MIGRKREQVRPAMQRKAARRMERQNTFEVLTWADGAGSAAAKSIDDYRRTGSREALADARKSLEATLGCIDALEERHT